MDIQTSPDGRPIDWYAYTPSGSAAWAFVVLFGIATTTHFVMLFPYRAWSFLWLVLGGICEAFGYYGRSWSHREPKNFGAYIMQLMLILCAPPLLAATIYMSLARVIVALEAEEHSMIAPRWLTKIYVLIDTLCFCSQLAGAGVQVTGDPTIMSIGQKVVMAGLVFQLVALLFFITLAAKVHRKINADELTATRAIRWRKYFQALYACSGCIFVRNLVRFIEYAQGGSGSIARHEVYTYIFDAFPMWAVMAVLLVVHPGRLVWTVRRRSAGMEKM